jgi:L-fuculose-phosphate aldolase
VPKCILPEVEVFLGEVPTAIYETPGTQKFADTIVPHLKASNTIILANHGTVTFGPDLEKAYWNSEIIDAYCRILILSRQLGNVNYFTQQQTRELLDLKKRLGYDDIRFYRGDNCDLCANDAIERGFQGSPPQSKIGKFQAGPTRQSSNGQAEPGGDLEDLVQKVTDQVMAALAGARG